MFKEIEDMKKNYIYPTVESVKVNMQMHLCDVSPAGSGINVNSGAGGPVSGGGNGSNPGDPLGGDL
jgi:hypothetical protein